MKKLVGKPGSVVDSHSSRACVATSFEQPTRLQCGSHQRRPIWSCSERGLPCHKLLPVARCALTAPFQPYLCSLLLEGHRRSTLCCTFRGLSPPRRYLAFYPMEPGLSSPAIDLHQYQRRLPDQLQRHRLAPVLQNFKRNAHLGEALCAYHWAKS